MNFLELTQQRYSARSYRSDSVEPEKIQYVLTCAQHAPSAVNYQPWKFLVMQSDDARCKLQACYNREWFKSAPLYIVVCAEESKAWTRASDGKSHADIDAAIAAEHICLAATDAGLGSCWVCNFDKKLFHQNFPQFQALTPIAFIPLGYTMASNNYPSTRKSLDELVVTI